MDFHVRCGEKNICKYKPDSFNQKETKQLKEKKLSERLDHVPV